MVASLLQDELAEELGKILRNFRLKTPGGEKGKVRIFKQDLPVPAPMPGEDIPAELLENGLAGDMAEDVPCPYIIVRVQDGEIRDAYSAQTVNVHLLFGVYEDDIGKQGHKDILSMIAKIYERFAKAPVLGSGYTIQYPVLWGMQEEESYPYYFGGMYLSWEAAAVVREDKYS